MTSPAKGPNAPVSGNAQVEAKGDVQVNTPNKVTEDQASDTAQKPWQLIPKLEVGAGWGSNGSRTGHLFDGSFGKIGDFTNKHLGLGLLTNANGGKVQFRFGGMLNWDWQTGNQKTFGSTYHHVTLGPVAELNFRKGWEGITGENWSPLGYLGVGAGLGVGHGTGTLNDGLLHTQTGLASYFNAYLNVVNFSIGKVQIGLNFDYRNTHIRADGGDGNWPVAHNLGFTIDFQPSVKKMERVVIEHVPVCDDDRARIPELAAEVAKLKADNEVALAKVDGLRYYLENLPKNAFTEANVKKAWQLGYVAEALKEKMGGKDISTENIGKIQIAIKEAHKAEAGKEVAAIATATGLTEEEVQPIWVGAETRIAGEKGFWELPPDVNLDEAALAEAQELNPDEECRDVEDLRSDLENWRLALSKRNAALEQQYRRALHLAGLVLGEEVVQVGKVFKATLLRVDTPNFYTAKPSESQVSAITSAAAGKSPENPGTLEEYMKLAGSKSKKNRVFLLPEEEAGKLKNFADWMNGKARLQGEERHSKFLEEKGIKSAQITEEDILKEYEDWVKSLQIMVVGHTDSRASDEYNQKLSERRAEYIRQSLIFFGVNPDRVQAFGAGEKYPITPEGKTKGEARTAARVKNRRVEFIPVETDPTSTGLDRDKLGEEHHDASKDVAPAGEKPAGEKTQPEAEKKAPEKKGAEKKEKPKRPDKPVVPPTDIPTGE